MGCIASRKDSSRQGGLSKGRLHLWSSNPWCVLHFPRREQGEAECRHHSDSLLRKNDQSTGRGFERHDEECVAAMFYDVAQAIHDLHRHKLLQANLSFEGLLGEHKALDGAKPDADKTVISVQIPTFGLNTLGGTKPQDVAKAVHHKGACAPEILLDATNSVQPTEETDAWNLGVLLHVMLVGYPPLQEEEKEAKEQME